MNVWNNPSAPVEERVEALLAELTLVEKVGQLGSYWPTPRTASMSRPDFDERGLRSLRIFCAVAQANGFAAAEKQLNMSKASISRHIREVEDTLGARLDSC